MRKDFDAFKEQWDEVCRRLKNSKYDLNKIKLIVERDSYLAPYINGRSGMEWVKQQND